MISGNLSIDQLIEIIQNLNENEKQQVRQALEHDFTLSKEQEILDREARYMAGQMNLLSLEEVKTSLRK